MCLACRDSPLVNQPYPDVKKDIHSYGSCSLPPGLFLQLCLPAPQLTIKRHVTDVTDKNCDVPGTQTAVAEPVYGASKHRYNVCQVHHHGFVAGRVVGLRTAARKEEYANAYQRRPYQVRDPAGDSAPQDLYMLSLNLSGANRCSNSHS